MLLKMLSSAVLAAGLTSAIPAAAQVIVAPTSATINSGGPGDGSINNTFNQAGLTSGYTSGVTNFDTYIATNPQHSLVFACCEWFSAFGTSSASVTYDFGTALSLDALALWNEETAGIGTLDLLWSLDGTSFSSLGVFNPTDNPVSSDYGPQVFTFAPTGLRYVRFNMSNCPQNPGDYQACAIGEVAFRSTDTVTPAVPEPGTWAMMLLGFGAVGFSLRGRRSRPAIQMA